MIGSFIALATRLYRQAQSAPPNVRGCIMDAIHDARDSGMLPLGIRKTAQGDEYVWIMFDKTKLASATQRHDYMTARTPPGVAMKVMEM